MSETVSTEVADTISLFGGLNNSFTGAQAVDSGTVESSNQANTAGYDLVPTLRQSGTSSIAKTGSNGFCSKAASILSLPYEILQLIIEDEDLTCEDRFAFKLANRSFLHLKPEWDTLKSMISPEGRYDLACRLNWIPADTYLCSACRKRHDAAFFSLAEQRKTDQERKCIGMFSGVLLFENTLLTMSGIQKLLSEQGVCSHEAHVPVFLLLEQCDKDLQRVKRDRPARVDNPVKLNVRVSNQEHCNYVQYTLKHVTADDSLYLTGRARLYLPWLEFFISIAQHANHSNLALQTAWYHHMRLWTIPLCEHEDLSDSQVCARIVENICGQLDCSKGCCIAIECSKCWSLISIKFKKGSSRLEIRTDRYLGAGIDPCDPCWLRNVHTVKTGLFSFGERWNMRNLRPSFLDHLIAD